MRQEVVTSLTQSYEQARIEEVRNTPVITVLEPPELPVIPDQRGLLRSAILGLLLGGLVGVLAALGREFLARSRDSEPEAYARLVAVGEQAAGDLRRLFRFGGRRQA